MSIKYTLGNSSIILELFVRSGIVHLIKICCLEKQDCLPGKAGLTAWKSGVYSLEKLFLEPAKENMNGLIPHLILRFGCGTCHMVYILIFSILLPSFNNNNNFFFHILLSIHLHRSFNSCVSVLPRASLGYINRRNSAKTFFHRPASTLTINTSLQYLSSSPGSLCATACCPGRPI